MRLRTSFIFALVFSLIGVAALLPGVKGPFFADDLQYIVRNQGLIELDLYDLAGFFSGKASKLDYLPVRDMSYRLDLELFGSNPYGFHLHNLLLYLLCCLAAWFATRFVHPFIFVSRAWQLSSSRRNAFIRANMRPSSWATKTARSVPAGDSS